MSPKKNHIACFQVALVVLKRLFNILCTCANILNPDKCWSTYISESDLYYNSDFQLATVQLRFSLVLQLRFSVGRSTTQILTCTTAQIFSWSTLIGPGFANAHGHPQIFAVPWMPWKSILSRPTLIEPGFANAHAYPPSLCQCHGCRLPWSSVLGLVPGFASAHGNPQVSAVPWMPWKSTLSQSTRIGPGFASAHAYPPSRIQCHVDAMEIHTIQGRACQCPWTSTMDAMEIHTIQVYPYRARVCQCPCISTQSESKPWMQTTLVFCVRAGARLCQCPWKSTNLFSAMDAMEIHTIPVYPYRAGSRACQHAFPQIFSAPLSQSTLIGPGLANAHAYPPSRTQCHVDAMEIQTIQGLPMPTHIHPV